MGDIGGLEMGRSGHTNKRLNTRIDAIVVTITFILIAATALLPMLFVSSEYDKLHEDEKTTLMVLDDVKLIANASEL